MNRLQKKCAIATAGVHLLLLLVLLIGPGFFERKEKPDDMQILDVIPANAIDAAFNSGVKNATSPPPTPEVKPPQPQVAPHPPVPQPKVAQKPTPEPEPEKVKPPEKLSKDDLAPIDKEPKPKQPHKVEVSLKPVVKVVSKTNQTTRDDSQERQAKARAKALDNVLRNLKSNLSSGTTIDMPGNSSVAYANYAQIVKSIYDQAWTPPDDLANADENVKVHIVISSDGSVVSARITDPSGDKKLDNSVQRVLDRVRFIAPFPEGTKDRERSYDINFNPKTKQMLG